MGSIGGVALVSWGCGTGRLGCGTGQLGVWHWSVGGVALVSWGQLGGGTGRLGCGTGLYIGPSSLPPCQVLWSIRSGGGVPLMLHKALPLAVCVHIVCVCVCVCVCVLCAGEDRSVQT